MTSDTIDRILDDATMPPAEYCFKHGLLADGQHEWEEVVSAFAVHLIGRTEAVMRRAGKDEGYRLGFDEGFASADDWLAEHEQDMREHGWMCLPVGSDGVPIHVADRLMYAGGLIIAAAVSPERVYYWSSEGDGDMRWTKAVNCRHYVPHTVENVLLECCKKYHGLMVESMSDVSHEMPSPSEIITEYAAKLRLAGDEE